MLAIILIHLIQVDPIIREGKLQSVLSVTDRADTILICQKDNVNYAQYTPVHYKDNTTQQKQPQMAQEFLTGILLCENRADIFHL